MEKKEILESLKNLLADLLGVEECKIIKAETSLVDDLGAESIDFVDMCYQLEKKYKIGTVKLTDIYPKERDRKYSEDSVQELLSQYPYMNGKMVEKFREQESFEAINTFLALEEFLCWRVKNA